MVDPRASGGFRLLLDDDGGLESLIRSCHEFEANFRDPLYGSKAHGVPGGLANSRPSLVCRLEASLARDGDSLQGWTRQPQDKSCPLAAAPTVDSGSMRYLDPRAE